MKSSTDIIAWRKELNRCISHGYTCFRNHYLLQNDSNNPGAYYALNNADNKNTCLEYVENNSKQQSLRMR
jgi:hypothetical protein